MLAEAPASDDLDIGPGDDAAVWKAGQCWTCDTLVEGVHWDERLAPEDVGFKAVAVSVSDLIAMGARPRWALLSLTLPDPVDERFVTRFAAGFGEAGRRWDVALAGGDTTRGHERIVVTVTMGGTLQAEALTRSGGKAGDQLWVTGTPGLAALGYTADTPGPAALSALRRPEPPLHFALDMAEERLASAAMDLSDGLRSDLRRLCAASGVGARVHVDDLPSHRELEEQDPGLHTRLAGGDDYQLLFTAPPAHAARIEQLGSMHGVTVTRIGVLTESGEPLLHQGEWPDAPYKHFGGQT